MSYIKLFINVSKKKPGVNNKLDHKLETRINKIFNEPLEDLFDKPDLIRNNFEVFYSYSQDYYNELISKNIIIGSEQIEEVISLIVQTDKSDEIEYYKKLFLLEFLGSKIEG